MTLGLLCPAGHGESSFHDFHALCLAEVKSARCVINVAGPYMLTQGELMWLVNTWFIQVCQSVSQFFSELRVVEFHRLLQVLLRIDCCISMGVHYCDISGEIPWSRRITPLNTYAQRNKAGKSGLKHVETSSSMVCLIIWLNKSWQLGIAWYCLLFSRLWGHIMRIRNGDPCSCPSASCTGDDSCSIDRPSSFPVQLLLVASQTFAPSCVRRRHMKITGRTCAKPFATSTVAVRSRHLAANRLSVALWTLGEAGNFSYNVLYLKRKPHDFVGIYGMFHHVSSCFIMFHHVSSCFITSSAFISQYFTHFGTSSQQGRLLEERWRPEPRWQQEAMRRERWWEIHTPWEALCRTEIAMASSTATSSSVPARSQPRQLDQLWKCVQCLYSVCTVCVQCVRHKLDRTSGRVRLDWSLLRFRRFRLLLWNASEVRAEDLDANMSKISEDKHLGIWRGPNVYSYFDTRIVRPKMIGHKTLSQKC